MAIKVLIIEDEPEISKHMALFFAKESWLTFIAQDGEEGLVMADREKPDLIILDIMLPKLSGIEVCKRIRAVSHVPIIMVTAKGEEIDKLLGLELGADDYVTKPFSLVELVARAKAILRRCHGQLVEGEKDGEQAVLEQGDFTINLNSYQVEKNGEKIALTPTEFQLLHYFCENPHRVLNRNQLINKVLGYYSTSFDRTIDTHISNLRKKIEDVSSDPQYLQTIHSIGYRFVPTGKNKE